MKDIKSIKKWMFAFVLTAGVPWLLVLTTQLTDTPDRYVHMATVFAKACLIFSGVLFIDRLLRLFVARHSQTGILSEMSQGVIKGLLRGFVIGIGVLVLLDLLGISITPILASLGVGSLAVALALQDTLSNFFSGLYISVDRPVRTGDFVKLETGQEGYVVDVGWRNTRIRTLSGPIVIIPNTKLVGSVITNYYLPTKQSAVLIEAGVHYESDLGKVERVFSEVATEVMKSVEGAVPEFRPFVRFHTFGDRSINFTVIMQAREFTDNYLIKHEFIKKLMPRIRKEKIMMPYVNLIPLIPIEEQSTA